MTLEWALPRISMYPYICIEFPGTSEFDPLSNHTL